MTRCVPPVAGRSGFTLIELLVVISIIAILAAMLLPAITMVRMQAQKNSCRNNLRAVTLAVTAYCGDNEGYFPLAVNDQWSDPLWSNVLGSLTQGSPASQYPAADVNPYYGGGAMPFLYCPLMDYDITPVTPGGKVPANWRCPARQDKINTQNRPYMRAYNATWRVGYWWNYPNAGKRTNASLSGTSRARLIWDHFWPDWSRTDFMHLDGSTNVAFVDGHVEITPFDVNYSLQEVHDQSRLTTQGANVGNTWYIDGWTK